MGAGLSAPFLPYGAAEILALRQNGKRPADMVLVSLIGPLHEMNPVIIAKPERSYDWRFLSGLSVLIVVTTQTEKLSGLVQAIENMKPEGLSVWFSDQQDGVNILIDGWKPRSKAARRMDLVQRVGYAGLGSFIPTDECLKLIAGQAKRRAMQNAHRFDSALVEFAQGGFRQIFGQVWGTA